MAQKIPAAPVRYTQAGAPQLTVLPGAQAAPRKLTTREQRLGKQSLLQKLFPSFFGGVGDGKISKIELAMFSRQLATFISAGVPITRAISVIAEETTSKTLKHAMRQVLEDLGEGLSVAESFSKYPKLFSPLYVNMVRAAELTGNLDAVLRKLDQYLAREDQISKKIKNALSYPIVVLFMAAGSVLLLITFVLPRFGELFKEFKAELPITTKILLGISTFTTSYKLQIAIGLVGFIVFIVLSQRTERGRYARDALMLRAPVIGRLTRYAAVARFSRTLSTMLGAGVPVARSFDIVMSATGNRVIQRRLRPVKERLMSGEGFAGPLADANVFPPMVIQLVRVGEETGSLEKFLGETADYYEAELGFLLDGAIALIEPAMMLTVGGVVGFVAISMVSAVYALTDTLK
ncbi:MAG: type II secretion system F family protein [Candidatus Limnocylindria bacterium]|nr:type II secretion system F family protein [Candidatus Limnocylindria bacterium]